MQVGNAADTVKNAVEDILNGLRKDNGRRIMEKKRHNEVFTILLAIVLAACLFGCGRKGVNAPKTSDAYAGAEWKIAYDDFSKAGFKNISTKELKDIGANSTITEGSVETISVNGTSDYSTETEYDKDAEVIITYHAFAEYKADIHVIFTGNFIFDKYDVDLLVDGEKKDTLEHGTGKDFRFVLPLGEHVVTFANAKDASVKGETTLNVTSDLEAEYRISCKSDFVSVTEDYVDYKVKLEEGQVKMTTSSEEFYGDNYKAVIEELEKMGFTNIKAEPLYDIVFGFTDDGELESITIDGKEGFKRGEIYSNAAEVIVNYHTLQENDPAVIAEKKKEEEERKAEEARIAEEERKAEEARRAEEERKAEEAQPDKTSVEYSTNTEATVRNGNSGIYSYKNRGGSYEIFYIIDFDEGYVYYFCDGNGDDTCDRLKIDSGDLNDVVIITYHDGDDIWSEGLHFKRKNQPDHLVVQDNDGFEWDYYSTNLNDAMNKRDQKKIRDY